MKLTPIQANMKVSEKTFFSILQDKREKPKPKYNLCQPIRITGGNTRTFSK